MSIRLGYACINMTLSSQKPRVTTNRSMIKRTFLAKGLPYASELIEKNSEDLLKILQWNEEHNITLYRMSSDIAPWASEYRFEELPGYDKILSNFQKAGNFAKAHGHRLSFHPGAFCCLASKSEKVVQNAIKDLNIHGEIMDMLGQPRNHNAKINIHVGGAYGDPTSAIARFCKNFQRLSEATKSRLTLENDDKKNMYSVKMLYEGAYKVAGIPIVFDYHHHKFCTGGMSEHEALEMAASTWGNIVPNCHYSESRCIEKNIKCNPTAHSDYVYNKIEDYGLDLDICLEAKAKELAVLKYREMFEDREKTLKNVV